MGKIRQAAYERLLRTLPNYNPRSYMHQQIGFFEDLAVKISE